MNAVEFVGVSKRFRLFRQRSDALKTYVLAGRGRWEPFWALRGVSFSVAQGETVGIVGGNGSGKSTTLRLIARILEPTDGEVRVSGRVGTLLDLEAGQHNDLTGRENIFLTGALLGLSRREVRRRFDAIVEFAGAAPFLDTPLRSYSTGMRVRLGFSVAVHVEAGILLVDEVLAVGDQAFQEKCLRKIADLQRAGTTVMFVSHDMALVRAVAKRVLWLDGGGLRMEGDAGAVLDAYARAMTLQTSAR